MFDFISVNKTGQLAPLSGRLDSAQPCSPLASGDTTSELAITTLTHFVLGSPAPPKFVVVCWQETAFPQCQYRSGQVTESNLTVHFAHKVCLCVSYDIQNRQRLMHYTA